MRDRERQPGDLETARRLYALVQPGKPSVALLCTVSPEGRPHPTWMFACRSPEDPAQWLTITSPDSDKAAYLRSSPLVEWLLGGPERREHLYLEGRAEVLEDVAEIKRVWQLIEGKERAYFMRYYNSGMGFAIIRTTITAAVLSVPEGYRKAKFEVAELV